MVVGVVVGGVVLFVWLVGWLVKWLIGWHACLMLARRMARPRKGNWHQAVFCGTRKFSRAKGRHGLLRNEKGLKSQGKAWHKG